MGSSPCTVLRRVRPAVLWLVRSAVQRIFRPRAAASRDHVAATRGWGVGQSRTCAAGFEKPERSGRRRGCGMSSRVNIRVPLTPVENEACAGRLFGSPTVTHRILGGWPSGDKVVGPPLSGAAQRPESRRAAHAIKIPVANARRAVQTAICPAWKYMFRDAHNAIVTIVARGALDGLR